ncbi:MAG: vitamin K epoxide reductase family protein [Gemmatimonadota bacterium]
MEPRALSRYLREGDDPDLRRRRWVVGLSLLGAAMGQVVSLYQTGILKHLPDPPGPFDSDRVDASEYAYSRFDTPDALAMVVTYGVTACLAGAGGPDRPRTTPWLPVAAALKTLYDTGVAAELGREEWRDNRALCAYCQVATVASAASLALALPEAVRAARHLLGRDGADGSAGGPAHVQGAARRGRAVAAMAGAE